MSTFDDPKGRAIRKQALVGLVIFLGGVGLCFLLARGHDVPALDQDPTPLMPGLVVGGIGTLLVVIARIRHVFHRPRALAEDAAEGGLQSLLESLV